MAILVEGISAADVLRIGLLDHFDQVTLSIALLVGVAFCQGRVPVFNRRSVRPLLALIVRAIGVNNLVLSCSVWIPLNDPVSLGFPVPCFDLMRYPGLGVCSLADFLHAFDPIGITLCVAVAAGIGLIVHELAFGL